MNHSFLPETTSHPPTLDSPTMSETFFVTPAHELEGLDDWKYPLAFQAAHHHEIYNGAEILEVEWRLRDRVKSISFLLFVSIFQHHFLN